MDGTDAGRRGPQGAPPERHGRGPQDEPRLGIAAVGLWHRLRGTGAGVGQLELMTLAGSPDPGRPHEPVDDVWAALDELLALGWADERDGRYRAVHPH